MWAFVVGFLLCFSVEFFSRVEREWFSSDFCLSVSWLIIWTFLCRIGFLRTGGFSMYFIFLKAHWQLDNMRHPFPNHKTAPFLSPCKIFLVKNNLPFEEEWRRRCWDWLLPRWLPAVAALGNSVAVATGFCFCGFKWPLATVSYLKPQAGRWVLAHLGIRLARYK